MPLSRITASSIADGTIVASDIADGSITGPKLGATSINANNIVNSGVTANTYGNSSSIPVITVSAKGLLTSVTTATVSGGQYFGTAAVKAISYNSNNISENVTVTSGNNGLSAGPITIANNYFVTIETGAGWVIV